MRDIKFRAWDTKRKCWVKYFVIRYNGQPFFVEPVYEPIIMQYIGIKDRHGKEIYEGDIVRLSDGDIHQVVFCEDLHFDSDGAHHPGFYFSSYQGRLYYSDGFDGCEVLGNAYEHSSLMKEV